jgi:hypothetical protein
MEETRYCGCGKPLIEDFCLDCNKPILRCNFACEQSPAESCYTHRIRGWDFDREFVPMLQFALRERNAQRKRDALATTSSSATK